MIDDIVALVKGGSAMSKAGRKRARGSVKNRGSVKSHGVREGVAAERARARRGDARRRALLAGGSIALVVAVAVTIIVVKLTRTPTASAAPAVADAAAGQQVTDVPAATFDSVGTGTAAGLKTISGQPELTLDGKPELLYMGGEYCPFCAAERWVIASAVSRFGALSGLRFIHSSPTDIYPDTPTLSFYRSGYASKYLAFAGVEWYGETPDPATPTGYAYLQQPTTQQAAAFARYGGSFPFVDIGNRYLVPQAQYVPSALAGLTWAQVTSAMRDPSSPVARDIDGAANMITAAICKLTNGQPAGVCTSAGVKAANSSI